MFISFPYPQKYWECADFQELVREIQLDLLAEKPSMDRIYAMNVARNKAYGVWNRMNLCRRFDD
jgi:hypothetical protein